MKHWARMVAQVQQRIMKRLRFTREALRFILDECLLQHPQYFFFRALKQHVYWTMAVLAHEIVEMQKMAREAIRLIEENEDLPGIHASLARHQDALNRCINVQLHVEDLYEDLEIAIERADRARVQ